MIFLINALHAVIVLYFDILPKEPKYYTSYHMGILILMQAVVVIGVLLLCTKVFSLIPFSYKPIPGIKRILKMGLLLMGVNIGIGFLYNIVGIQPDQFEMLNKINLREDYMIFLICVACIAPWYEELFFRGFILSNLVNTEVPAQYHKWYQISGVCFSSLLFTLMHVDMDASIGIFAISIVFSIVTIRTQSITVSTILHITQNSLASIIFLFYNKA